MPARFIIDSNGTLRYSESCPDYRRRPEMDELLVELRSLAN